MNVQKSFPFRNHQGKLYVIETEFVEFVLKTFQEVDHNQLVDKANQYKKDLEIYNKKLNEFSHNGVTTKWQNGFI